MFGLAAGFYQSYLKPPQVNIVFVGLDGAGKTALLERVKVTDFTSKQSDKRRPKKLTSSQQLQQQNQNSRLTGVVVTRRDIEQQLRQQVLSQAPGSLTEERRMLQSDDYEENKSSSPFKSSSSGRRRIRFICPISGTYRHPNQANESDNDESDDDDDDDDNYMKNDGGIISLPGGEAATITHPPLLKSEYSLKPGSKMFPLHLIRPTVGMNLAKFEAHFAKCHFMDLGGSEKMRPLWERYYSDADAIVFVVDASSKSKLSKLMEARAVYRFMRDDDALQNTPTLIFANKMDEYNESNGKDNNNNNKDDPIDDNQSNHNNGYNDDDDDDKSRTLGSISVMKLAQLFVSTGNVHIQDILSLSDEEFWEREQKLMTLRYRAGTIQNPNDNEYENDDHIVLCGGSAKTGEGVQAAFDWLIPRARDLRLYRDRPR